MSSIELEYRYQMFDDYLEDHGFILELYEKESYDRLFREYEKIQGWVDAHDMPGQLSLN